ncbi:MAG: ribosome recycling factor [Bacilli bacterium]|jgi:ribosome recycling factor|nr:ribosome recycling factor [Bacilli bacterium]MCX4254044.1 ribosome recycling factor [Bacilli bacterium]
MDNTEIKMQKAIENLESRLLNIRAGRANPAMLNGINAIYYGTPTPVQSLANITVPEARSLMIKPFDKGALKDIERALNEANLGITPVNNGEVIILTVPELTEDKRKEYVKLAKNTCEEARVALRNIRQDANNLVKKEELPEDQEKNALNEIQELVNTYNKKIDEIFKEKEAELMRV